MRNVTFHPIIIASSVTLLALSSCAGAQDWLSQHPFELNNVTADNNAWLSRNPEVAEILEQRAIPADDQLHFSGNAHRLHDKTGAPIGWQFQVSVKVAWPRRLPVESSNVPFVLRPPWPRKPMPPDSQFIVVGEDGRRDKHRRPTVPEPWREPTPIPGNHAPVRP